MKKKEKGVLAPAAVSEVCLQLAFILESGMALEDGVGALADESEKDGLQPGLSGALRRIERNRIALRGDAPERGFSRLRG